MTAAVHVSCLSQVCAVGLTPQSVAAALRSAVSGIAETHYCDNAHQPVVGGMVPGVPDTLRGRDRIVELLVRAFNVTVQNLPEGLALDEIPILVCTGEQGRPGARTGGVIVAVEHRLGLKLRREHSGHISRGPVSAFDALH
jgi:hypothetical protein